MKMTVPTGETLDSGAVDIHTGVSKMKRLQTDDRDVPTVSADVLDMMVSTRNVDDGTILCRMIDDIEEEGIRELLMSNDVQESSINTEKHAPLILTLGDELCSNPRGHTNIRNRESCYFTIR